MKLLIYLISLIFVGTSHAHAWEDFYILKPGQLRFERAPSQKFSHFSQSDCRSRIQQITCIVNPSQNPQESRQCQADSPAAAPTLEKIYDILPPKLQKVFCGLDVIYIENELESLAYAGVIQADAQGNVRGSFMGIRRSLIEQNYDATSVFGWKEQKAFGIKAPPFVHLPEGPRVDVTLPISLSALHYIIVHEFAHILDFSNSANHFICPEGVTCDLSDWNPEEFKKLVPKEGSWGALSWESPLAPRPEQKFPLWSKLCFYGCTERLGLEDIEAFYHQLHPTNFVSTYAAVSPFEDFAESLTFAVMAEHSDFQYQIQTPYASYSLETKWREIGPKKIWMQDFLNRDLKYPSPMK